MVLGGQSPVSGAPTASSSDPNGFSVEGSVMVPSPVGMLYDYTQQLPCTLSLFQQTSNASQMDLLPQLAVWPISGKNLDMEVFQRQLKSSYLHPGEAKPPEPMILTLINGWASVLNRVLILFRDPFLTS